MTPRQAGRIVASLLFIVTLGIIAFALYRNASPASGTVSTAPTTAAEQEAMETLNASMEPVPLTALALEGARGVASSIDPDTGKLELMMTYASLEPLPNGMLVLESPMAWFFQGKTVILVEAAQAQVNWPSQDREPESGELRGGVEVLVFPDAIERFEGDSTTLEQMGEASMHATVESANFNAVLMELTTLDPIEVTAPGLIAKCTGMNVRVSEVDRTLKLLRFNEFHSVTYDPNAAKAWKSRHQQTLDPEPETEPEPQEDALAGMDPVTPSAAPDEPEPRIDLYHATFTGSVHLTDTIRTLEAEQIDLWARMFDGSLADSAIASFDELPSDEPARADAPKDVSQASPASEEIPEPIITFTGSGPFEIRPLRDEPAQLARDDVYLQIQSPLSNAVVAHDALSGATLKCVTLGYGATTRKFTTLGLAGTGVTANVPGVFEAVVGRFDQDLSTGEGVFPGPGVITLTTDKDAQDDIFGSTQATIRWQDGCEFSLDTSDGPIGASDAVLPRSVRLRGRIEAAYAEHTVRGDEALITFGRGTDPETGKLGAVLDSIRVSENARLVSEGNGRIAGDELVIAFDQAHPGAEPTITLANASGNVLAEDPRGAVRAEFVEAAFSDDGEPLSLTARDSASVTSPDGYIASGDSIEVDLVSRTALLNGNASLGQTTDDYIQTLNGEQIYLDETTQVVEVLGAGLADYTTPKRRDTTHDHLKIEWSEGMRYNNLSGQADFLGAALITAERTRSEGEIERVIGKGSRLTVHLTPYTPEGARRLLRVEIEERASEDEPAELDLRQFAFDPVERLVGLLNLRGPRIVYDAQVHRLIVPEPGTLLVDDRRTLAERGHGDQGDEDFPDVRGSTGFWWEQALMLDLHDAGHEAQMLGRVRMVHQPRAESDRLELECERLIANIAPDDAGASEGDAFSLQEVRAEDAVFVRQGSLELIADDLRYDGATQRVTAGAAAGNRITILDALQRNHYVAEEVSLDILTGRWTITRGAAIAMPGG